MWKNLAQDVRAVGRYDPNVRKRVDYDDDNDKRQDMDGETNSMDGRDTNFPSLCRVPPDFGPTPIDIHYRYQILVIRDVEPSDNILESCAKSKNAPILTIIPPDT